MAHEAHAVQLTLELPFPELVRDVPLLPAHMINEYAYCPRRAYLEWVQGEWEESRMAGPPSRST